MPRKYILRLIKQFPRLYHFLRYDVYSRFRSTTRHAVFHEVYQHHLWKCDLSVSGPGSTLESTAHLRAALPKIIAALGGRVFQDIPCGDFNWMKEVALGVEQYIGGDIVLSLIKQNQEKYGELGQFLHIDLLRDPLPPSDIVLCRDCLVHLSLRDIQAALTNIARSPAKYLFTTTFPNQAGNDDTVTPNWRPLNMEVAPFCFPPPLYLVKDFADSQLDHVGKHLGVWRLADLPLRKK